jgi:hypothetical protein
MTSLGALPKKMTLPPALAKARRLSSGSLGDRVHRRNQNGAIRLAAQVDQFAPMQLERFRQRVFVHVVEVALMLEELVDDGYEGGVRGGVVEPEAARRNIDADLRGGAAFAEQVADAVDMGGEGRKAGSP